MRLEFQTRRDPDWCFRETVSCCRKAWSAVSLVSRVTGRLWLFAHLCWNQAPVLRQANRHIVRTKLSSFTLSSSCSLFQLLRQILQVSLSVIALWLWLAFSQTLWLIHNCCLRPTLLSTNDRLEATLTSGCIHFTFAEFRFFLQLVVSNYLSTRSLLLRFEDLALYLLLFLIANDCESQLVYPLNILFVSIGSKIHFVCIDTLQMSQELILTHCVELSVWCPCPKSVSVSSVEESIISSENVSCAYATKRNFFEERLVFVRHKNIAHWLVLLDLWV